MYVHFLTVLNFDILVGPRVVQGDGVQGVPGPGAQDQGCRQDGQAHEHEALRVNIWQLLTLGGFTYVKAIIMYYV